MAWRETNLDKRASDLDGGWQVVRPGEGVAAWQEPTASVESRRDQERWPGGVVRGRPPVAGGVWRVVLSRTRGGVLLGCDGR